MEYLWLKALHVAAVIAWTGGMLANALAIAAFASRQDVPAGFSTAEAVARWDRLVTAPAMLLAWALGLMMAVQAGWFSEAWLMIKLVVVAALSALHGWQSGTLRRTVDEPDRKPPALLQFAAPAILTAIAAIAVLVVTKPF